MSLYNELLRDVKTLIADNVLQTPKDLMAYLNRCSSLQFFAAGCYANVYLIPNDANVVIKICFDPRDGYPFFAKWCMNSANANNSYLPNILQEDILTFKNGVLLHCYVVERLQPLLSEGVITKPCHINNTEFGLLWGICRTLTQKYCVGSTRFSDEITTFSEFITRLLETTLPKWMLSDQRESDRLCYRLIERHQSFLETLFDVLSFIGPIGLIDLNGSNFMCRGDTVVITDPLAHKCSTDYRSVNTYYFSRSLVR